ncbi:hypothetical protein GE061_005531 [Apolygus lucorum]|uniref:Uncharacterized protein n=1 Tax=Apolygus lucorum TaxID=248454 RepID=A0A6A4J1Y0_APOLU|nr:hypothetical protein GE061_005531 [Apolygus lucorum]
MNLSNTSGTNYSSSSSTEERVMASTAGSGAEQPDFWRSWTSDSRLRASVVEEEVNISNIFADTYAKANGLYNYPKTRQTESWSESSDDESYESENEVNVDGSWRVQGSIDVEPRPDYYRFIGQLQGAGMSNCTDYTPVCAGSWYSASPDDSGSPTDARSRGQLRGDMRSHYTGQPSACGEPCCTPAGNDFFTGPQNDARFRGQHQKATIVHYNDHPPVYADSGCIAAYNDTSPDSPEDDCFPGQQQGARIPDYGDHVQTCIGPCCTASKDDSSPGSSTDDRSSGQLQREVISNRTVDAINDNAGRSTNPNLQQQQLPHFDELRKTVQVHSSEKSAEMEQTFTERILKSEQTLSDDDSGDSTGSWTNSESNECDVNVTPYVTLSTCSDVRCPGNIAPFFQKYSLPKHKITPRGPNRSHGQHMPPDFAEGGFTNEQRKLQLRRMKNREAAKKCRKKKKEEFKLLLNEEESLLSGVHQLYHDIRLLKEKLSFRSTPTGYSYVSY